MQGAREEAPGGVLLHGEDGRRLMNAAVCCLSPPRLLPAEIRSYDLWIVDEGLGGGAHNHFAGFEDVASVGY